MVFVGLLDWLAIVMDRSVRGGLKQGEWEFS
jgi:hypothetical protein